MEGVQDSAIPRLVGFFLHHAMHRDADETKHVQQKPATRELTQKPAVDRNTTRRELACNRGEKASGLASRFKIYCLLLPHMASAEKFRRGKGQLTVLFFGKGSGGAYHAL